ncbi:cupin domain-containing protein [Hyphobacterium marinum]|uniref:Cupin domain-containing protein n=1 Tax=Hyphobacterium marinum TaxID=3116574 RepID=A0ABU7M050_9PROT|nr:cupin domain-containing protein [Hyphobacterium sp. Y6023]MEE2566640.1 cupin domain-containing protein [Hyphobacterium sp. Y6023]
MQGEPPAHWWIDAASGAAPRAVRGLFACLVELNPEARETAESLDLLGALMLEDAGGEPVGDLPMPRADLSGVVAEDRVQDRVFPSPLVRQGFSEHHIPWRSRLGGVRARRIDAWCEPGVDARLFALDAGSGIPAHDHRGEEFTLVLDGGFFDQAGIYHRGDMAYARDGYRHKPISLPGESCLCVTVSIGGYRFSNPFMALVERILR